MEPHAQKRRSFSPRLLPLYSIIIRALKITKKALKTSKMWRTSSQKTATFPPAFLARM
jgi:hypothetical protein